MKIEPSDSLKLYFKWLCNAKQLFLRQSAIIKLLNFNVFFVLKILQRNHINNLFHYPFVDFISN